LLVVLEDIFQMITFEVSGTSYLPFVHEMAMTTRRQRHGLSKLAEEIATLTISNGMCSHAGATGRENRRHSLSQLQTHKIKDPPKMKNLV
jgi:hypothetical protein